MRSAIDVHKSRIAINSSSEVGKIILLCGTSTAGKTSICIAAQAEASKTGHSWIVDGTDIASEKAWREPCQLAGKKYLSAQDHFVEAMKKYTNPFVVDTAVNHFGARTLAIALFSRRNLGNPKVDQVDLTPEMDIKVQAAKIYDALSYENKQQYTPEGIESLLMIIRDCPDTDTFFTKHPYPPLQKLNLLMLERAIARVKKGESTILDIVGNEVIDDKLMIKVFQDRLYSERLPAETGLVFVVHCPIDTLISRINERNGKAIAKDRKEEVRLAFFPFNQYGELYEKVLESDTLKPIIGIVTRNDIVNAALIFGKGETDAASLLAKLKFNEGEESISVTPKIKCDEIFQTASQSSQEIAEIICKKTFNNIFAHTHKMGF